MKVHNRKKLKQKRKELRNNSTSAEVVFWMNVKEKQFDGMKFRRQHSIGNYIVDFYCPDEKLAIELDGEPHYDEDIIQYDIKRTEYLNKKGITVLRFENDEVMIDINAVLKKNQEIF